MNRSDELFQAGDLAAAVAEAVQEVKAAPMQIERRVRLADYLLFTGDFDRADKQLDMAGTQDPGWAPKLAMLRQLVRGGVARQDLYQSGRPPELLGQAPDYMQMLLKALVAVREDRAEEAAELVAAAEEARPALAGTCDDVAFDDLRDLDDLNSGVLELFTTNGKFFWVPLSSVRRMDFAPPAGPRDLLWRQVDIDIKDGPQGVVYVPALYHQWQSELADGFKLGRESDWVEAAGIYRGIGQRCFLIADEAVPVSDITTLEFVVAD
jgi:type VI secretion system protein ImpE